MNDKRFAGIGILKFSFINKDICEIVLFCLRYLWSHFELFN